MNNTPSLEEPPCEVVRYRLPALSRSRPPVGMIPSAPPVKLLMDAQGNLYGVTEEGGKADGGIL